MVKRTGATLVEVLVAIFVMGIGMLALLTLFPVGILTMRQAIQDDRAGQAAATAAALAQAFDVRSDSSIVGAFTSPGGGLTAADDGPSFPVYADPWGYISYANGSSRDWVGGQTGGVARRNVSYVQNTPEDVMRWFTVLDDIIFNDNGVPQTFTNGKFERGRNYTWAYLLRRPVNGVSSVVELSVVVYNNERPLESTGNLQRGETVTTSAQFDPNNNLVMLDVPSGAKPKIVAGSWILDISVPNNNEPGHANFYRLVGVKKESNTRYVVETQTPILGFGSNVSSGTVVIMEGVVEVFNRGAGWQP